MSGEGIFPIIAIIVFVSTQEKTPKFNSNLNPVQCGECLYLNTARIKIFEIFEIQNSKFEIWNIQNISKVNRTVQSLEVEWKIWYSVYILI